MCFFFFIYTTTTEIYTLSLHDALPIYGTGCASSSVPATSTAMATGMCSRSLPTRSGSTAPTGSAGSSGRSEEHTSELQSQSNLVCRLLLEKKKQYIQLHSHNYLCNLCL